MELRDVPVPGRDDLGFLDSDVHREIYSFLFDR
jgi:hypothetical protein